MRVWAWNHPEHLLKKETPALGGEVEDLAWDGESKRIVAAGGGSSKAKVFSWDTGSNLGEIIPHSKKVITCDLRPTLPHRLIMGGEDFNVSFYNGAPFKYNKGIKEHTNFVNCARFSPTGALFVTVSSDKTAKVYAGDGGELVARLDPSGMHGGSVFSASWSPDGTQLVTSGGDKAVKLWDMAPAIAAVGAGGAGGAPPVDCPCTATAMVGSTPGDMQESVVWLGGEHKDTIISTSLDGTLNYFTVATLASGPSRRVSGHNEPMVALECDPATGVLVTGCSGGKVCAWRPKDEGRTLYTAQALGGAHAPTKKCSSVALSGSSHFAVGAWDDKLRCGVVGGGGAELTVTVPLGGQPKGVASSPATPDVYFVATSSALLVVTGGAVVSTTQAPWKPTCVALSLDGKQVAVGGEDRKVHFFTFNPATPTTPPTEVGVGSKEAGSPPSCLAFSPDAATLAMGDAGREVRLYATASRECTVSGRWMAHTTRVTGLKWSPNGLYIATVASDRRLVIWDPTADSPKLTFDLAHAQPFAAVAWASNTELWALGTDGVAVKKTLVL